MFLNATSIPRIASLGFFPSSVISFAVLVPNPDTRLPQPAHCQHDGIPALAPKTGEQSVLPQRTFLIHRQIGERAFIEMFFVDSNRREVGTMSKILLTLLAVLCPVLAFAQNAPTSLVQRQVQEQTIISNELPAADLILGKDFRYVGGQVVNLYGNADAEQHLFVKGGGSGPVQAFYWVQFEHFLPTNKMTYDYKFDHSTGIGDLQFIYDVKSFPDYGAVQAEDPRSDGAALARLLAKHNLAFPKRAAHVRMFHLPTADRRTELMIIYGEAVPEDSKIPVREGGVRLDGAFPEAANTLLDHALKSLTIHKH